MIVIAVVGILAAVAIPNFLAYRSRGLVARTASDLNTIARGFHLFALDNPGAPNEGYPSDTHRVLPVGVDGYVSSDLFAGGTPLGGYYNWEGPDNYPYAGVAIESPTASEDSLLKLDDLLDDGNFGSGQFQKTPNGRYTLIIWEP